MTDTNYNEDDMNDVLDKAVTSIVIAIMPDGRALQSMELDTAGSYILLNMLANQMFADAAEHYVSKLSGKGCEHGCSCDNDGEVRH